MVSTPWLRRRCVRRWDKTPPKEAATIRSLQSRLNL